MDNLEAYIKLDNDIKRRTVVDSVPTQNSTNLVQSGGVWSGLNTVNQNFGTVELTSTAAYPHAVGEYFINAAGQMVKCTAAIAVGNTITTGTNVAVTNVANVLADASGGNDIYVKRYSYQSWGNIAYIKVSFFPPNGKHTFDDYTALKLHVKSIPSYYYAGMFDAYVIIQNNYGYYYIDYNSRMDTTVDYIKLYGTAGTSLDKYIVIQVNYATVDIEAMMDTYANRIADPNITFEIIDSFPSDDVTPTKITG